MEQRNLQTLGIDIGKNEVSLAYIPEGEEKPVSMSVSADEAVYRIPFALFYRKEVNEFLIGEEALFAADNTADGGNYLVRNVYEVYRKKQTKYLEDHYSGEELLCIYLTKLLEKARKIIGFSKTDELVFTSEEMTDALCMVLEKMAGQMEIAKELTFLTHEEAFAFYVLARPKELWSNDVTLFSLEEDGMYCQIFSRRKENEKQFFFVRREDLSDLISWRMIQSESGKTQADEEFYNYLVQDYKTHIVSCVYFTGEGFKEGWYQKSVEEICRRRRAFVGFNLYSEGAALAGKMENRKDLCLFCHGRTKIDISVMREKEETEEEYALCAAGRNYRKQRAQFECILDNTKEMVFLLKTVFPGKSREYLPISMEGLTLRQDKTMCFQVQVCFVEENVFEIRMKETGFAEFKAIPGNILTKRISI